MDRQDHSRGGHCLFSVHVHLVFIPKIGIGSWTEMPSADGEFYWLALVPILELNELRWMGNIITYISALAIHPRWPCRTL